MHATVIDSALSSGSVVATPCARAWPGAVARLVRDAEQRGV